jgi:hypothetical protein
VAITSQPLPLAQATFSLQLLSQWTSWLLLVEVPLVIVAAVEALVVTEQVLEHLAVAAQLSLRLLWQPQLTTP